ncbi:MAG: cache domain-containing protein, partial [Caloramator sp.]|nr:cache domain-containing protein [Caloramator sp.]
MNKSIKNKLISLFILTAFVPTLIIFVFNIYFGKRLLEDKIAEQTYQIAIEKASYVDAFIQKVFDQVESLSKNPTTIDFVVEKLKQDLSTIKEGNPDLLYIYIGTDDNQMFIYPRVNLPKDYKPTLRPWYQEALASPGKTIVTSPYQDATDGTWIVTAVKQINLNNGKKAVIGADIKLQTLIDKITATQVGKTGYAALSLANGQIIAHPNKDMLLVNIAEKYDFGKEVVSSKNGNTKYELNNEKKIMGFASSKLTGWIVMATIPEKEYSEKFTRLLLNSLLFLILITIIASIIGFVLSNKIANPLI